MVLTMVVTGWLELYFPNNIFIRVASGPWIRWPLFPSSLSLSLSLSLSCLLTICFNVWLFGRLVLYLWHDLSSYVCGDLIIYLSIFGSDAPKHQPFSNCVLDCRTLCCNFFKIELFVIMLGHNITKLAWYICDSLVESSCSCFGVSNLANSSFCSCVAYINVIVLSENP